MITDPREKRAIRDIADHGWSGIIVKPDEVGPGFEYTIGFQSRFAHPEVILFGLPENIMHDILWTIFRNVAEGKSYRKPMLCNDVIEESACCFKPVNPEFVEDYFGFAIWHRRHVGQPGTLTAVQCFWPDRRGRFPWDADCIESIRSLQPNISLD